MNPEKHGEDLEQNPKLKKRLYIFLALLVGADFFVHREHATFIWDHIPGFSALHGLISTVIIILVAKGIGHAFLMKKEDYYD